MKKLLILPVLLLATGCGPDATTPADARFNSQAIERFRIQRERTPSFYPDLFLIHDSVTGSDFIAISDDHHVAMCPVPMPQPEKSK